MSTDLTAPLTVWILTDHGGVMGVYDHQAAAKATAERISRKHLNWGRVCRNTIGALTDETDPNSAMWFIELHGVVSADVPDPLSDGSAAAHEPIDDPAAANRIHRILAHRLCHGEVADWRDCPLCDEIPAPFATER